MAPPRSLLELVDDLIAAILLRLPPSDPACLIHASLVCKRWRRLLSDPAFLSSYRAFHRTPPLLGFLRDGCFFRGRHIPRFIPTTAVSPFRQPASDFAHSVALDCRHGRVLIHSPDGSTSHLNLSVWDPITGHRQVLPVLDTSWHACSGAVLCAEGGCDHLHCNGTFLVLVLIKMDTTGLTRAFVYSSNSDMWSARAYVQLSINNYIDGRRGALIGDEIYFIRGHHSHVLRYDLHHDCFSAIDPPEVGGFGAVLMVRDGLLGLVGIGGRYLQVWLRKVTPAGVAQWVLSRNIEIKKLIPVNPVKVTRVTGFAEGVDAIIVSNGDTAFIIELKSKQVTKVAGPASFYSVFPFTGFCTPAMVGLLRLQLLSLITKYGPEFSTLFGINEATSSASVQRTNKKEATEATDYKTSLKFLADCGVRGTELYSFATALMDEQALSCFLVMKTFRERKQFLNELVESGVGKKISRGKQ
ncbi:hypothetical protein ACP70R_037316 [Stipagrostis hirtigluma subsp. patula]